MAGASGNPHKSLFFHLGVRLNRHQRIPAGPERHFAGVRQTQRHGCRARRHYYQYQQHSPTAGQQDGDSERGDGAGFPGYRLHLQSCVGESLGIHSGMSGGEHRFAGPIAGAQPADSG